MGYGNMREWKHGVWKYEASDLKLFHVWNGSHARLCAHGIDTATQLQIWLENRGKTAITCSNFSLMKGASPLTEHFSPVKRV